MWNMNEYTLAVLLLHDHGACMLRPVCNCMVPSTIVVLVETGSKTDHLDDDDRNG